MNGSLDEFSDRPMRRRDVLGFGAIAMGALASGERLYASSDDDRRLQKFVDRVVQDNGIPGVIAATADQDHILSTAAAGVRKDGEDKTITTGDHVHIGSCTKAMTSTMIGTLVVAGKLSWDTTLVDVLPELKNDIHTDYHDVSLWQLVSHRAGIAANAANWWSYREEDNIVLRRLSILRDNLAKPSGTNQRQFLYSNLGYMVAGCMAERVAGQSWESLMKTRIFQPLGMDAVGFGPPGSRDNIDQPWGHVGGPGAWKPRHHDNAESLGPAGRIHCSLPSWSKFAALQLRSSRAELLARKELDRLTTPTDGNYAAGWRVVERPWAHGKALTHSGSNTMWFATVWVAPNINRVFMAATNCRFDKSPGICDQVISQMIRIDAG